MAIKIFVMYICYIYIYIYIYKSSINFYLYQMNNCKLKITVVTRNRNTVHSNIFNTKLLRRSRAPALEQHSSHFRGRHILSLPPERIPHAVPPEEKTLGVSPHQIPRVEEGIVLLKYTTEDFFICFFFIRISNSIINYLEYNI